jgi:hypothetical protein
LIRTPRPDLSDTKHPHRAEPAVRPPEQVVQLTHLLNADLLRDARTVAPIRVDRFGVTIRVDHPTGWRRRDSTSRRS